MSTGTYFLINMIIKVQVSISQSPILECKYSFPHLLPTKPIHEKLEIPQYSFAQPNTQHEDSEIPRIKKIRSKENSSLANVIVRGIYIHSNSELCMKLRKEW
jgi:hypothetical protein